MEFESYNDYSEYRKSLNWNGYSSQVDKTYATNWRGDATVSLQEFTTPIGVGHVVKSGLVNAVKNKMESSGYKLISVKMWQNLSGYFVDRYRVEVTGYDPSGKSMSGYSFLPILAIVVGALALLGFAVAAVLIAIAVFKYAGDVIEWLSSPLIMFAIAAVAVAISYNLLKGGKKNVREG